MEFLRPFRTLDIQPEVSDSSQVIEDPLRDLDKFRLTALVRVPGVLRGSGVVQISTASGHFMVVDLDKLNSPEGVNSWRDVILLEGKNSL